MKIENDYDYLLVKSKYPRLGLGLELRWGTSDFEPYIIDLLKDTRDHSRNGFPVDFYDALNRLLVTHSNVFPDKKMTSTDIWEN